MDKVKLFNCNSVPVLFRISPSGVVTDIRQGPEIFYQEDDLSKRKRKKRVNRVFVSRGGIRL